MPRAPFRCDVRVLGSRPEGYVLLIRFAQVIDQPTRKALAEGFESFIPRSRIAKEPRSPWYWLNAGSHDEACFALRCADHHDSNLAAFYFAADVEALLHHLHTIAPINEASSVDSAWQEGQVDESFESARSRQRVVEGSNTCAHHYSSRDHNKVSLVRVHDEPAQTDLALPEWVLSQIPMVHCAARTPSGSLVVQGWTATCDANAIFIYDGESRIAHQSDPLSRAADTLRFQLKPDGTRAIVADLEQVYEIDIPSARTTPLLVASEAPDYYPVGTSDYILSYVGACYAGPGQILVTTSRDLRLMDLRGEYPVVTAKLKCPGGTNVVTSCCGHFAVVECPKNTARVFYVDSGTLVELGKLGHCSTPFVVGPHIYTHFRNGLFRFDNLQRAAKAAQRRRLHPQTAALPAPVDRLRWS